jgi:hypothetical protein
MPYTGGAAIPNSQGGTIFAVNGGGTAIYKPNADNPGEVRLSGPINTRFVGPFTAAVQEAIEFFVRKSEYSLPPPEPEGPDALPSWFLYYDLCKTKGRDVTHEMLRQKYNALHKEKIPTSDAWRQKYRRCKKKVMSHSVTAPPE